MLFQIGFPRNQTLNLACSIFIREGFQDLKQEERGQGTTFKRMTAIENMT